MGDGDGGIGLSKKDLMDLLFTCIRSGDPSSVRASARILLKRYPDDAETLFFTGMFSFGLDPEEGMVYWERLASSMHNLEGPEAQRILDLIYPQMVEVISNYYVQGNFESYSGLMSMGKDLAPYGRALVQDVIEAVPSGIQGIDIPSCVQAAFKLRKLATACLFHVFPGHSLDILRKASDSVAQLASIVNMLGGRNPFAAYSFRVCSSFLSAEWENTERILDGIGSLGWDSLSDYWQEQRFDEFSETVGALEVLFQEYFILAARMPDGADEYLSLRMRDCFDLLPYPGSD